MKPKPVWLLAGIAVPLFAVHLSLLPGHLTAANFGADGGDLLSAILTGGVPHPTGYPTYVLLGKVLQLFPFGSPAWRGALLSALPAALASALLGAWGWRLRAVKPVIAGNPIHPAWLPALVVGLAWGISPLFFSQAVVVEVHGLQALFVLLALVWVWLLLEPPPAWRKGYALAALAYLYGLGLGNHITLLIFLPAIGAALWSALRRGLPARWALAQMGTLLLGSLVYLYLPLSARNHPPVNWGDPQSWQGFLWVVSGGPYRGLWLGGSPVDLAERLLTGFGWLRQQYGLPGLVLGAAGALVCSQTDGRLGRLLGWVFVAYWLLAVLYHTADSIVYLIPAALVWVVWIAFALWYAWGRRWRGIAWGRWVSVAFLVYLLARFPAVYRQVDPRPDHSLDEFTQGVMQDAPSGALILTQSDPDTFSLWYAHLGLKARPDLAVVSLPLTVYPWYRETLAHTYPDLSLPPEQVGTAWEAALAAANPDRPVCRSRIISEQPLSLAFECQPPRP